MKTVLHKVWSFILLILKHLHLMQVLHDDKCNKKENDIDDFREREDSQKG